MSASPGADRSIRITKPDGRPEIRVGVDIARMTDAAIGALAHDGATYQRAGKIVAVVTVPDGPMRLVRGVKRMAGTQTIIPLISGSLRERCSSAAHWVKFDGRREAYTETVPPENVISAILARGEWGGIRPLVSVATCPQLRPDGSILQRHGYDEETGILYWPSDVFPDVAENPGLDDARGALEAIREVVCDFPFARPEHESAWIAGLLTMLARPAIDGPVPMFAVDATTRGTGKSRLVDAASTIALGHHCARTSMPEDDDEMRKRITSLVLDGDPSVCLDNIVAPLAMPSLDAVLTSMTWKDRLSARTRTSPRRTGSFGGRRETISSWAATSAGARYTSGSNRRSRTPRSGAGSRTRTFFSGSRANGGAWSFPVSLCSARTCSRSKAAQPATREVSGARLKSGRASSAARCSGWERRIRCARERPRIPRSTTRSGR